MTTASAWKKAARTPPSPSCAASPPPSTPTSASPADTTSAPSGSKPTLPKPHRRDTDTALVRAGTADLIGYGILGRDRFSRAEVADLGPARSAGGSIESAGGERRRRVLTPSRIRRHRLGSARAAE